MRRTQAESEEDQTDGRLWGPSSQTQEPTMSRIHHARNETRLQLAVAGVLVAVALTAAFYFVLTNASPI